MHNDCINCHQQNIIRLVNKHTKATKEKAKYIRCLSSIIDSNLQHNNVYLSTLVHRAARNLLQSDDLYQKEKDEANNLLMNTYEQWQKLITTSKNPAYTAMKLAIIGNIIDYGAHSVPDDIEHYINIKLNDQIILDHSESLFEAISQAKSILYLGDNAGEIVFDKLFIETIGHQNVTYAVRGAPVINDVTINEATSIGMPQVCQVISNGHDAPSTLLNFCCNEFQQAYQTADLIISKGQGNFEGLLNKDDNRLYFLLTAKCNYIANLLKVQKNDLVVANAHLIK